MNTHFMFFRATLVSAFVFLFTSCDDDISTVGAGVLPGTEIGVTESTTALVETAHIDLAKAQSSTLNYNLLGNFKDAFGETDYSILFEILPIDSGQLPRQMDNDTITKIEIDKVTLSIPFNYENLGLIGDNQTYRQTNIVSAEETTMEVNVFRSNFSLQDANPSRANVPQFYYANGSDGNRSFETSISTDSIGAPQTIKLPTGDLSIKSENGVLVDDNDMALTADAISKKFNAITLDFDEETLNIFKGLIGEKGENIQNLTTSEFTDVFRGIYIKTINNDDIKNSLIGLFGSNLISFNTIKEDGTAEATTVQPKLEVTFKTTTQNGTEPTISVGEMLVESRTISLINLTNKNEEYDNLVKPGNDDNTLLALKGGVGSAGSIKLFNDEQISDLVNQKIIINDARLRLTINQEKFFNKQGLPSELPKLFLYDLENGSVLADFPNTILGQDNNGDILRIPIIDNIANIQAHIIPSLPSDEDKKEDQKLVYEFNITDHIERILGAENTEIAIQNNNTLGVTVIENITDATTARIDNPESSRYVNNATLLTTKGVALFGSDASEENRPQLILKYTTTN